MLNYKIASNCNYIMNINFIFLIPDLSFCLLSRHFTNCLDNRQNICLLSRQFVKCLDNRQNICPLSRQELLWWNKIFKKNDFSL